MTVRLDPVTLSFILVALIAIVGSSQDSQAEGVPLTIDAQVGGVEYTSAGPSEVEAVTKAMTIPSGYKMVKVSHPPSYVCSEYATPDTFELRSITTRTVTVGQSNVDSITIITDGE